MLMTAHYSSETAVEAIKKGGTDYLTKPISIALVREKIGKLIEAVKQRQKAQRLQDAAMMTMNEMIDVHDLPPYMHAKSGHTGPAPASEATAAVGTRPNMLFRI
jgi:DNA-binding NtrC family response regulator